MKLAFFILIALAAITATMIVKPFKKTNKWNGTDDDYYNHINDL